MAVIDLRGNKVEPLNGYCLGYLDAAVGLFERSNRGAGYDIYTFYSAAYCLRHGLELFVKLMSCYLAYELRDRSLIYEPKHGLKETWRKIQKWVEFDMSEAAFDQGEEDFQHHEDVINEVIDRLDEIDKGGTLFRYPEWVAHKPGTDGTWEREDTHLPFDHVNLADWHGSSSSVLDAACAILDRTEERAGYVREKRGDPFRPISRLARELTGKTDE